MKKVMIGLVGLMAVCGPVLADSYTYTYVSSGNTTNLSDALPVSGWLDKIEIINSGSAVTTTVTAATYNGTAAVETFATKAVSGSAVIRPRVLPTDNTGTALAAAGGAIGTSTNLSQILVVPYDRPLLGGNLKVNIVNAHPNATTNSVVFYFEPVKK